MSLIQNVYPRSPSPTIDLHTSWESWPLLRNKIEWVPIYMYKAGALVTSRYIDWWNKLKKMVARNGIMLMFQINLNTNKFNRVQKKTHMWEHHHSCALWWSIMSVPLNFRIVNQYLKYWYARYEIAKFIP